MRMGYYWAKTKRDGMWAIVERFEWGWSYSNAPYYDCGDNTFSKSFNEKFEVYYYIGTKPFDNIISLKT